MLVLITEHRKCRNLNPPQVPEGSHGSKLSLTAATAFEHNLHDWSGTLLEDLDNFSCVSAGFLDKRMVLIAQGCFCAPRARGKRSMSQDASARVQGKISWTFCRFVLFLDYGTRMFWVV